jgi:hypothetical protein
MGAMTLTLVMVFAILPALVLGFLCGRIWQIRCDELQRRASFTPPSVAGIPLPRDAETNGHAPASAARCRWKPDNRLDQSGTADLFAKSTPAKSSRLARKSTSVTSRPTSPEKLLMGEP